MSTNTYIMRDQAGLFLYPSARRRRGWKAKLRQMLEIGAFLAALALFLTALALVA